jgi:cytochrome P450
VVATGSLTIPLMKKVGYHRKSAGAIEAAASTGGQIMPPIMGAGAFIMAEITGIPYTEIAMAPRSSRRSSTSSRSTSWSISRRRKLGMRGMRKDELPKFASWSSRSTCSPDHHPDRALFMGYSVIRAGTLATVGAVVSWLTPHRMGRIRRSQGLRAGRRHVDPDHRRLRLRRHHRRRHLADRRRRALLLLLLGLAGTSQLLALFFAMCISILLGMGMPTTAAYAVAASVVAPGLMQLGIPPLTAHFFVFYFAVVSAITPPVALASLCRGGHLRARTRWRPRWPPSRSASPPSSCLHVLLQPGGTAPRLMDGTWPAHLAPFYAVEAHSMLELEPPRHTRLRGLVLRAFTSRRIRAMAPEIEALAHDLAEAFPEGPFDLLDAFCRPIPVIVIARLLGVPESMADELLRWSNAMVMMYQAGRSRADEDAAVAATEEFVAFMRGYIDRRRGDPRDDLISALIAAEQEGERLTTDEMITTCILLLNAGHEATVHTLGNAVKLALETGARPAHPERFVEEVLRHDPPLHLFTRWAYEEVELFGHTFRRGDEVGLLLASAGRDEAEYAEAALFRPDRSDGPANLAFGAGLHFCVGAPLARLELQIALPILFARWPALRLAAPPRYADIYHFHGLGALSVSR